MLKSYRVDKRDNYQIEYRQQSDGTIKLYARSFPPDPFEGDSHAHHILPDGSICVSSGNEPRTLDRAKAIAVHWMEGYSQYIRTGTFPNESRRVRV